MRENLCYSIIFQSLAYLTYHYALSYIHFTANVFASVFLIAVKGFLTHP